MAELRNRSYIEIQTARGSPTTVLKYVIKIFFTYIGQVGKIIFIVLSLIQILGYDCQILDEVRNTFKRHPKIRKVFQLAQI